MREPPAAREGRAGRPRRGEVEASPRRDWLVAGLALAGLAVSAYLTWTKLTGGTALLCTTGSGCGVVQGSRYGTFLGLPTAAWGAGLYAAIGGLALRGLTPPRWLLAFLLSVAGVSFSAYLTYLELFVIEAVCGYCVVSAVVAAGLFGLLLGQRPPGPRRLVRAGRLVAWGGLTAVATVLLGVGVYAIGTSREAASYQEALARHLQQSGAVMYGAFW